MQSSTHMCTYAHMHVHSHTYNTYPCTHTHTPVFAYISRADITDCCFSVATAEIPYYMMSSISLYIPIDIKITRDVCFLELRSQTP